MKAEYYRDFYGSTASLKERGNRFILTVRLSDGRLYSKKSYTSRRGAKIALGKMGECWKEK